MHTSPRITTSAKVVCDSVSPAGARLTTIEVTFARFVLAEVNTHRAFSRNSASSRAIPTHKQIRRVVDDPFVPLVWASERPGMQGGDELTGWRRLAAVGAWRASSLGAAGMARAMVGLGVHKSIANRLIEPFCWHTAIVTATDWDNFFDQRCSPLAQPELRVAAEAMRAALGASTPKPILAGEWHLPYIEAEDWQEAGQMTAEPWVIDLVRSVSVARCARVSYLTHDGRRDLGADLVLYERLVTAKPPHASPLEHVATPCRHLPITASTGEVTRMGHLGNIRGWDQLRHMALSPGDDSSGCASRPPSLLVHRPSDAEATAS